uniref:Uncharacterized protein n=1 Tax=Vespula pensylvanica TaxID=30213 RepID=A0A834JVH8_VESPE|nr:hypothetical protein H0235_017017 [Vespula pensylvanica]
MSCGVSGVGGGGGGSSGGGGGGGGGSSGGGGGGDERKSLEINCEKSIVGASSAIFHATAGIQLKSNRLGNGKRVVEEEVEKVEKEKEKEEEEEEEEEVQLRFRGGRSFRTSRLFLERRSRSNSSSSGGSIVIVEVKKVLAEFLEMVEKRIFAGNSEEGNERRDSGYPRNLLIRP